MPTFSARRPRSISTSIAQLMGSSPELSGMDIARVSEAAANANRNDAAAAREQSLAEKARLEMEQLREMDRLRRDPEAQNTQAGFATNTPLDVVRPFRQWFEGRNLPPPDAENIGIENYVPTRVPKPEITPQQEQGVTSHIGALLGLPFTKDSNVESLAKAGGEYQTQQIQGQATNPALTVEQQNRLVTAGKMIPYLPMSPANTQGVVTNLGTGTATVANQGIYDTALKAATALASVRNASAGLSGTRSRDITATQPHRIAALDARAAGKGAGSRFTPEQVQRWIDSATLAEYRVRKSAWDGLALSQRKGIPAPTLEEVRKDVNTRYHRGGVGPDQELEDARRAIESGKDPDAVRRRFKERTGLDMPVTDGGETN